METDIELIERKRSAFEAILQAEASFNKRLVLEGYDPKEFTFTLTADLYDKNTHTGARITYEYVPEATE